MKSKDLIKQTASAAALCAMVLATANSAVAATSRHPAHQSGGVVHLNPTTLRRILMNGNDSVLLGLNQTAQAKAQVNLARAGLLPQVNVGAIASAASFGLSSVTILLPFLLPSNWFNVSVADANLSATGYGFYVTELNELSNGYTLYETVLNDVEIRDVYQKIADNYAEIEDTVRGQYQMGIATLGEVNEAKSNTQQALAQVQNANKLIDQNNAAVREALGLPLTTQINYDSHHMQATSYESKTPHEILRSTYFKSPERDQIIALIAAAKAQKLSTTFSFLGGASLGFQATAGSSHINFGNPVGSGTLGLNPQIFPAVQINQLQIDQLYIQQKQVYDQEAYLIELSLHSIQDDVKQLEHADTAVKAAEDAFQDILAQYKQRLADLDHVDLAANTLETALIAYEQAELDLDNQRVSFNRMLIADQYAKVRPCVLANGRTVNPITGFFSGVFQIFETARVTEMSVDKLCRN